MINDHKASTFLVNEQTEIALLLSAPIFIAMIGLAPWVIDILYSKDFAPAVEVLRWQILGDILKVASWPLGFIILAAGAGKTYFLTETLVLMLMGVLIANLSSFVGLRICGIAFLVSYVLYLPVVYILAKRRIKFEWNDSVFILFFVVLICCIASVAVSFVFSYGVIFSLALSFIFLLHAINRLMRMLDCSESLSSIFVRINGFLKLIKLKQ